MKVGEYVRTEQGIIAQCYKYEATTYFFNKCLYKEYGDYVNYIRRTELKNIIKKSSPNIVDLIEYGDIVKYKIDDEEFISEVWGEKNDYFVQNFDVPIDLKDLNITSIVTKEQFEAMKYESKR